jgi:hypothetical protein
MICSYYRLKDFLEKVTHAKQALFYSRTKKHRGMIYFEENLVQTFQYHIISSSISHRGSCWTYLTDLQNTDQGAPLIFVFVRNGENVSENPFA